MKLFFSISSARNEKEGMVSQISQCQWWNHEPPASTSASASTSTLLTKTGFFRNKKTIQEPVDTLPMVPWLSLFATRGGQLSALQWARENGCDWGEYTFAAAQICGIKDVLNYVIDECPRGVYNQHS